MPQRPGPTRATRPAAAVRAAGREWRVTVPRCRGADVHFVIVHFV